jgi:hypothetical protein
MTPRAFLTRVRYEQQQKTIRELRHEISGLRKIEAAASAVRAKERALELLEPGGAEHVPRHVEIAVYIVSRRV